VSNQLAAGNAQTPGQPSQNGQQNSADNNNLDPGADPQLDPGADPAGDAGADGGADPAGGADPGADGGGGAPGGGNRRDNFVPQGRFDEVVAERNAAMDYGNFWREQATRGVYPPGDPRNVAPGGPGAPGAGAGAGAGVPDAADDPQPTLEAHNFDAAKWAAANNAWMGREIQRQVQANVGTALSTVQQQQEAATVQNTWQQRTAEFRAKNPDFDAVTSNPTLPITKEMAAAIMRSDVGPAVYLHLGKNPPEAARIARMHPAQQALAIARLEGRFEATQAAPGGGGAGRPNGQGAGGGAPRGGAGGAPSRTGAPPPPNPVRTGSSDPRLEDLPLDDYVLARMKERAGHR
jgi:hypothetical protein